MIARRSDEQVRQLRKHVQELLDKKCTEQHLPFRLAVQNDVVEGDWVYFVVLPDREGVRAYEYAKALSDVEAELARDEKEEGVLLVPSVPE